MNLNTVGDYPPSDRKACPFQFRLRSLFVVMTLAAIGAIPTHGIVSSICESLWQPSPAPLLTLGFKTIVTNVHVPDGGFILIGGGIKRDIRPLYGPNSQFGLAPKKSRI